MIELPKLHLSRFAGLIALVLNFQFQSAGFAQIASPGNAGQNSGNNSFGSSTTSIGTPNFSRNSIISLVPGVSVEEDGTLVGDTNIIESIQQALFDVISSNPVLLEVMSEVPGSTGGELVTTADQPIAFISNSSEVLIQTEAIEITIGDEMITISTTPSNQQPVINFVNQALKANFSPSSLLYGGQLVAIGSPVKPTVDLVAALQGLAVKPKLAGLAAAIDAFNRIVNGASPSLRIQLTSSPEFLAAGQMLRAARSTMSFEQ
jgi:hypothetical protein